MKNIEMIEQKIDVPMKSLMVKMMGNQKNQICLNVPQIMGVKTATNILVIITMKTRYNRSSWLE